MARKTIIPTVNTFEMRPAVVNRPARYHLGHLETDWQRDLIRNDRDREQAYLHKVERGDPFRFVFDATANTSHTLTVIDCRGATVLTIAQTSTWDVAGNVTDDSTQIHSYLYRLADLTALDEGQYYLVLSVNYDGTHSDTFISEPFWLLDTHEDTLLLEGTSTVNDKGVWFEQAPVRMPFRVEGYIGRMVTKNVMTVAEGQEQDITQLDSTAYREFAFVIGESGTGVSDWALNKINHFLDLERTYFNGKQYEKAPSASLDKEEGSGEYLFTASVAIREPQNSIGIESNSEVIDLFGPLVTPYAVSRVIIGGFDIMGAFSNIVDDGHGIVLADGTALANFITALNAALANYELYGTIADNGSGKVQYIPAEGEDVRGNAGVVHQTSFGFTFSASAANSYTLGFALGISSCVVEWGDGTYTRLRPGFANSFVSHVYPTAIANYSVKIWGDTDAFLLSQAGASGSTPVIPQGVKTLVLGNYAFTANTFDFNAIGSAQSTLSRLWVINCGLTAANNFNNTLFPYLSNIDFSRNALSSNVVSAFMYDVWRNATNNGTGYFIRNGSFSISAQTPAATLTAFGNTYKSILQSPSLNWSVYV